MAVDPIIGWTATGLIAVLLGAAAWHKLTAFAEFRDALTAYQLLPIWAVPGAAVLFAVLEAGTVAGLLLRWPGAHLAALALLAVYSGAMLVNLLRGRRFIDCGCGGASRPISGALVCRNAVLMGVCLLAAPAPGTLGPLGVLTVAAAVLTGATLYAAADHILTLRALLEEPDS